MANQIETVFYSCLLPISQDGQDICGCGTQLVPSFSARCGSNQSLDSVEIYGLLLTQFNKIRTYKSASLRASVPAGEAV